MEAVMAEQSVLHGFSFDDGVVITPNDLPADTVTTIDVLSDITVVLRYVSENITTGGGNCKINKDPAARTDGATLFLTPPNQPEAPFLSVRADEFFGNNNSVPCGRYVTEKTATPLAGVPN